MSHIQDLLKSDPAAALAALDLHKKAFPRELLATEREGIEGLPQVQAEQNRQAHPGAAPL